MKTIITVLISLFLGVVIGFFLSKKISLEKPTYVKLKSDYSHPELGTIKKGVLLRYDESSSNFTRYMLYLNISDAEELEVHKSKGLNEIIPYWIERKRK